MIAEAERSIALRDSSLAEWKNLFARYQHKKIDYEKFREEEDALFRGADKRAWKEEQDAYIRGLLRRVDFFNRQIFFRAYGETVIPATPEQVKRLDHEIRKESAGIPLRKPAVAPEKKIRPPEPKKPEKRHVPKKIQKPQDFTALFSELEDA